MLNVLGSVIVAMSSYLQQLCAAPSYQVIHTGIRPDGGDVPFGSPVTTIVSLFRRFRRSVPVICVWALLLSTSLVMHLCLNGIIGFQYHIQTYYYNILRENDLNPILFTLEPSSAPSTSNYPILRSLSITRLQSVSSIILETSQTGRN